MCKRISDHYLHVLDIRGCSLDPLDVHSFFGLKDGLISIMMPLEKDMSGDAGACDPNQTDQDQGAILALFSLSSSRAFAVLDDPFGRPNQVMIGRVLLCWTP